MDQKQLLDKMMEYEAGHPKQIQHFIKVHSFAALIGKGEQLDEKTQHILETAAIVHDIGIQAALAKHGTPDGKFQELEGPALAEALLLELGYARDVIDRVCYLVGHHHTYRDIDGPDYQILLEADFLVNMYEDQMSKSAVLSAFERIFRSGTGIRYGKMIYQMNG